MALLGTRTGSTLPARSNPDGPEDVRQQENKKPLQEWLESISERMMRRIDVVGDDVQKLVDECGAVELDLKNTFNSFRCLSSTQFVENRVYEEDETESVGAQTPARESQHSFAPTENYEDEILPRYKDAVSTAWTTFQEINHQHDQASRRLRSRNKVLRNLDYDGRLHLVPHIIGTDEFARDIHCGLAELRHKRSLLDGYEVDSDTERGGADLAAELLGAGSVSEGEWSEADSDVGDQGGGIEPAVSAALDFKAMLEAALRNPSLPYDGNSSTQAGDKYGEDANNDYFLTNVAIDNFYASPRSISRTVESADHRAGDISANTNASDSGSWQLTGSHIPGETAVQSTADSVGVSSSLPSQLSRDKQPLRATMEELLKKPFVLKTQSSTKEDTQNSSGSNVQLEYSGLVNIPFISGGLFDDDEDDTVSLSSDHANVSGSNTEPTVPEGLFQRQPSVGATEHANVESQSSSSLDPDKSRSPTRVPYSTTLRQSSKLDLSTLFKNSESQGSLKLEISGPSSSIVESVPEDISDRSETSDPSRRQVTAKSTIPTQIRGGLFDDTDDDEDAGDLFGKSLSMKVTDVGINSEPVLRTWTSGSSKGLFDDLEDESVTQETQRPQQPGFSRERPKSEDISSLFRTVSRSWKDDSHFPQRQASWTITSESPQEQIPSSSLSVGTFDGDQKGIRSFTPTGSTPAGSSPDTLQKQSPSDSLSRDTLKIPQQQFSDSYLHESSVDGFGKYMSAGFVVSNQKQSSGSSLVESVPDRANMDSGEVKVDLEDGAKEKISEPHITLESLLAAGIRPTARTVVYSSDDSGSWSSSGSDSDGEDGKPDSPKSIEALGISTEGFVPNREEDTVQETENKPAAETTIENNKSSSLGHSSEVFEQDETKRSPPSFFGNDLSSTSSFSRPGSSSDTQVMEMAEEEQLVKSLSSSVERETRLRLPSLAETSKSGAGTSSGTNVAEKLVHTTLSRPIGPSKRRAPSPAHTLKSSQSLPVRNAPQQSEPPPRNLSLSVLLSSAPSAPVIDIGRSTGRTFTSLFEEDDGEDDLFGADFPQKQSGAQLGSKPRETKSPLNLATDFQNREGDEAKGLPSPAESRPPPGIFQTREQDEAEEFGSPLTSKSPLGLFTTRGRDEVMRIASPEKSKSKLDVNLDVESERRDKAKGTPVTAKTVSPVPSRVPTTSPAKSSDPKVDHGELPSGRSTSKLSSLLFGDDDEDSEDALFGPLRGKSSKGTSDLFSSTSSFSPARTTSTRRTSGSSLFDD